MEPATPTIAETAERRRTVAVATTGTVLALVAYTTPVGTLAATASALGAGPSGQAWILSSMSCGLAVALLPAGAIGDDHGRRRMFVVGALVLAVAAALLAVWARVGLVESTAERPRAVDGRGMLLLALRPRQ